MEELRLFFPRSGTSQRIAAGGKHTTFVTPEGKLYTCGTSKRGQLGTGTVDRQLVPVHIPLPEPVDFVAAGYTHTAIVTSSGQLYMYGSGEDGKLGTGQVVNQYVPVHIPLPLAVKAVSCGHSHTAILTVDGKLYMCGQNRSLIVLRDGKLLLREGRSTPERYNYRSIGLLWGMCFDPMGVFGSHL